MQKQVSSSCSLIVFQAYAHKPLCAYSNYTNLLQSLISSLLFFILSANINLTDFRKIYSRSETMGFVSVFIKISISFRSFQEICKSLIADMNSHSVSALLDLYSCV